MLRCALLALCLCGTWAAKPPSDVFFKEPGASFRLSTADTCLPAGGTTVQGKPPIKLLMVPTAMELTYLMAILLYERLVSGSSTTATNHAPASSPGRAPTHPPLLPLFSRAIRLS